MIRIVINIMIYGLLASCVSVPDSTDIKMVYLDQLHEETKLDSSHNEIGSLVNQCKITVSNTIKNNFLKLKIESIDFSQPHILFVAASDGDYISHYIALLGATKSGQYIADSTESKTIRYLKNQDFESLLRKIEDIDKYSYELHRPYILHSRCYYISVYKNNEYRDIIVSSEMIKSELLEADSDPVTIMIYFLSKIKI